MANQFTHVQVKKPSSNTFNLSHDRKFTMEMGTLTPVFLSEALPGDSFRIKTETLIRFAPLIAPVMHNINAFIHYFFVPNRIVWDNWKDFISPDLSDTVPPAWPHMALSHASSIQPGSLADYLGLPTGSGIYNGVQVSAFPFSAYQAVYNEFYRDENLQEEFDYKLLNGNNGVQFSPKWNVLRRRAWQHDYFTSALPFAQKGPVVGIPVDLEGNDVQVYRKSGTEVGQSEWMSASSVPLRVRHGTSSTSTTEILNDGLFVRGTDMEFTTAGSINDLRVALRLQEFFEKAARGGTRYIEQIKMHWDVTVPDFRLDRPEFIGGTRNPVIISEVLQTSESAETPQATMAGHGISASSGKAFRYRAPEHGYIIGIMSVLPNTAYQQGIPRHFSRQSWEDYAWPSFAHLGEQPILNKELYLANDGENDDTFGYTPRYSEYRYMPSTVHGYFRDTMKFWHFGRYFENRPQLNAEFIEARPTQDPFAVVEPSNQNLWCHAYNNVSVRRKLPKYGTPTL